MVYIVTEAILIHVSLTQSLPYLHGLCTILEKAPVLSPLPLFIALVETKTIDWVALNKTLVVHFKSRFGVHN